MFFFGLYHILNIVNSFKTKIAITTFCILGGEFLELNLDELQKINTPENIVITIHAAKRLEQRGISLHEVMNCIQSGEIIEQYPEDYPYPSCLILGNLTTNRPLHAVIGANGNQLWIITAYYPSSEKWLGDLKTRKEE